MVNPYNGPAAKLLTPSTLTLVKMTIAGHHMVIQSTSPKISQAPMSTLAQVAKVTKPCNSWSPLATAGHTLQQLVTAIHGHFQKIRGLAREGGGRGGGGGGERHIDLRGFAAGKNVNNY